MSDFLTTLKSHALLTDGAMGSYLFQLTGRLSETNHVYEAFNVEQPELIQKIHLDYLAAGARCLKTNTFGANHQQLRQYGLESRLTAINHGGVERARNAIAQFQKQTGAVDSFFVLGSIGPTTQPQTDVQAVETCYRGQISSLIDAGVDAVILETFDSLEQLELVIDLVRSFSKAPPVIAMTCHRLSRADAVAFVDRVASRKAAVAGVNCCAPWDASSFVDAVKDSTPVRSGVLQLAVMPNAGGFQRIGSRFMTSVNPEFAGRMARGFLDSGVRLIGGCCEMHPPHIREMNSFLRSRQTAERAIVVEVRPEMPPAGDAEKRTNGPLSRKLKDGQFVVSVELLPPRGTDPKVAQNKVDFIAQLAASKLADAVDITDGSRGIPLMPPGDFVHLAREQLGWDAKKGDELELIPHFTGRDLNLMGVQSRLIGYHANRIRNVLFITGDPPKMSPTYPSSTAVFDVDSVALIRFTAMHLNAGVDFGGAKLGKQADARTRFTVGTGFEPASLDEARELRRLQEKLDHGADYVMTQPVFHHAPMTKLEKFRAQRPFLVGVMVLTSLEHARRMTQIPGLSVPDAVLNRLSAFTDPLDQAKAGAEIAAEQIRWVVREGWAGVYLMSPATVAGVCNVLRAGLGK
ncbi:MAG TPA: homocysteine S-methyltransferase family protein [Verrucomicrobiae bacterium]|nr:homocysteine S-methyltransferase family protein [Verrucomicrobiae bacterium]